jgi:hypothetical protein
VKLTPGEHQELLKLLAESATAQTQLMQSIGRIYAWLSAHQRGSIRDDLKQELSEMGLGSSWIGWLEHYDRLSDEMTKFGEGPPLDDLLP